MWPYIQFIFVGVSLFFGGVGYFYFRRCSKILFDIGVIRKMGLNNLTVEGSLEAILQALQELEEEYEGKNDNNN